MIIKGLVGHVPEGERMTEGKTCKQDGTELCAVPENNSPNGVCVLNKCPQANRQKRNEITIYNIKTSKLIPGSDGAWDVNTTVVVISNIEEDEFLTNITDQLNDQDDTYRVELTKVSCIPEELFEKTMKALKPWVEEYMAEMGQTADPEPPTYKGDIEQAEKQPENDTRIRLITTLVDLTAYIREQYEGDERTGVAWDEAVVSARDRVLDHIRSQGFTWGADINQYDIPNEILFPTPEPVTAIPMDRFLVRDDGGSEQDLDVYPDEILEGIEDWVKGGDWGDGGCVVRVSYYRYYRHETCGGSCTRPQLDECNGECPSCGVNILLPNEDEDGSTSIEIPQDPYKVDENLKSLERDGHEHSWSSPYEIVGGLKENPGVWNKGGVHYVSHQVCVCGAHRHAHSDSQRLPVEGPTEWEEVDYPDDLWPWGKGATFPGEATADCDLCDANVPADKGASVEGTILPDGETGWFCWSCIDTRMEDIRELYGAGKSDD